MSRATPPGDYIAQSGLWVERNVGDDPKTQVDIIRCPAFGDDWKYEFWSCNKFTDDQLREAMSIYQFGVAKGMECGRAQMQSEIRKVIGLPDQP